jgi:two-component system response regulator CpxR
MPPLPALAPRNPQSILLIDDDPELCSLMRDFFEQHGFTLESVCDGRSGLARAIETRADIVLLDVMLPVIDGLEVLRQIRRCSPIPTIMLTARTGKNDRISGLDAGADDYLPKPFEPTELLARVRALLRRVKANGQLQLTGIERGGVKLNPDTRKVYCQGEPVELTSVEFEILHTLMRAAGRIVSRDELTLILHQRPSTPFERALDVHISHLRKKLGCDEIHRIHTMRGLGYMFGAEQPK